MRKSPKPTSPKQDLSRKRLGDYGEQLAAKWYEDAGFEVVERQWHGARGELDLVLRYESLLVFCEVKTRSSLAFGSPAEAVTPAKQRSIRSAATEYLREHAFVPKLRFDVACIVNSKITVIEDAF